MGDLVNTVAWGMEAWVGQSPHAELTLHSVGSYLVTRHLGASTALQTS